MSIFHSSIGRMGLAGLFTLTMSYASAESMNYLTGGYFGDAKWLIPVLTLFSVVLVKHNLFILNEIRGNSGQPILSPDHPAEIRRIVRLIMAVNRQEQIEAEERSDMEISLVLDEVQQILASHETDLNSSSTYSPFLSDDEIDQLKRHIEQLESKLTERPDDPSVQKFLTSARSRLQNTLQRKIKTE